MTSSTLKISVLIPAYQSADSLPVLLPQIKTEFLFEDILVVDDGSTDRTSEIAELANCRFFRTEKNQGKGAAIRKGLDLLSGSDWVICMDSDLQHDPKELHSFLSAIQTNEYDLIIGHRHLHHTSMPITRQISNFLTSKLIRFRLGHKVPDSQCGYRAIRMNGDVSKNCKETGYMFETEYLIKSSLSKRRITWIPVKTIYNSSKSYLRPWVNTQKFITLWFRSFFWN